MTRVILAELKIALPAGRAAAAEGCFSAEGFNTEVDADERGGAGAVAALCCPVMGVGAATVGGATIDFWQAGHLTSEPE